MLSFLRTVFGGLMLAALGIGIASAQTIDFTLLAIPSTGSPQTISNGTTIPLLATNIGAPTQVTIVATYTGTSTATFAAMPQLLGSTDFKLTVPMSETFPLPLTRGQTLTYTVTYTPTTSTGVSVQVAAPYTEPGTSNNTTVTNSITLLFEGFAPSFTLSYFITPPIGTPNVLPIDPGGTITFPATQLNTTATGGLQINNIGSGPGGITGIALVSGAPFFQISGVPLISPTIPYSLAANTALNIGILYTPTAVETDTGQIMITYQNGTSALINLSGSGATSSYTYSYISTGSTPTTVKPGGTITLPSVPVSTTGSTPATSSVILTVKNAGNANGTINSINATGPFALSGQPNPPPTLKPGDTEGFTITYTPTQVGPQKGNLSVGNDTFTLSGTGIGPQLTFFYTPGSGGTPIPVGTGSVIFPATAVSQSKTETFTVTNSGTSKATISLITTSGPFTAKPPATPIVLAPNQSSSFPVTFTPVATGPISGTLFIDSTQVPLFGSGDEPPALPSYTITGPSGTVSPATQSNVSLTLAKSYPVDLNGILTLTTSGDLGTDPSVQFSTGSRTVDFIIPANSTSANFAGQGSQILLQTGTVAETITLTPTFATTTGVDVTPASPSTLQFTIASLAPVVESIQVTGETASSFTLLITGYSTTRSLTSLSVTFNPAPGYNLGTSTSTSDLTGPSTVWFQSTSSQAFGGQFQISAPFNLTGPVSAGKTLIQAIASVSATVSNSVGVSNTLPNVNVQ